MHLIFLSLIISFIFGQQSSVSTHAVALETFPDFSAPFQTELTTTNLPEPSFNSHLEIQSKIQSFDQKIQIQRNRQIQKKIILQKAKNEILKTSKQKIPKEIVEISENEAEKTQIQEEIQIQNTKIISIEPIFKQPIFELIPENLSPSPNSISKTNTQLTGVLGFDDAENSTSGNSLKTIFPEIPKTVEITKNSQNSNSESSQIVKSTPKETENSQNIKVENFKNQIPTPISFDSAVISPKIETVINSNPASSNIANSQLKSSDLNTMIVNKCQEFGCDSAKILKVVQCESGGRNVSSPGGHVGPFQFTNRTFYAFAKQYGLGKVDIWNTSDQVEVATRMFAEGLGPQHWSCY